MELNLKKTSSVKTNVVASEYTKKNLLEKNLPYCLILFGFSVP